jgi:hypothetical protein
MIAFPLMVLMAAAPAWGDEPATASTLLSGDFDDYLMIAADPEAKMLSGYYDDGKCRFAFRGARTPIELDQRSDFGEAYSVDSWEPSQPQRRFTTTVYSRAKGGYQTQLTLEPGQGDANRPPGCRSRISLDRADNVGDYKAVRVIRSPHAPVFTITGNGKATKVVLSKKRPPKPGSGVWVARTYSAAYSPKGLVAIGWYSPPGTPHGGYVRERDLYPLPKAE